MKVARASNLSVSGKMLSFPFPLFRVFKAAHQASINYSLVSRQRHMIGATSIEIFSSGNNVHYTLIRHWSYLIGPYLDGH